MERSQKSSSSVTRPLARELIATRLIGRLAGLMTALMIVGQVVETDWVVAIGCENDRGALFVNESKTLPFTVQGVLLRLQVKLRSHPSGQAHLQDNVISSRCEMKAVTRSSSL